MDDLKRQGKWEALAELQYGKLPALESRLAEAEAAGVGQDKKANRLLRTEVGAEEIRRSGEPCYGDSRFEDVDRRA